ncbi:hypothetical protein AXG93_4010s1020 [Marchantia polymorpha subsp. ruderalis]|uniref:SMP domain-containing protein n=1 Tax=Marchantia polymorpha subsp. ruderalis TaxID=1480154 RepID=A0A176VJZ6_MARPO|nr:hypothetical protein AXG93_4010s1020 [Marchantia polymorpha subsp. ruderalis]
MHKAVDEEASSGMKQAPPQQEPRGDCTPQRSFDSGSDQESSLCLGLSVDSRLRDEPQDEQIEKLKEFLSEAASRGDDVVTQHDADTVKAFENLQNLQLGTNVNNSGLAARLESAARANREIENQAASGFYPSETVYLEEHTLKEVLEESGSALSVKIPSTLAAPQSPRLGLQSPNVQPSPRPIIDAEMDAHGRWVFDCCGLA